MSEVNIAETNVNIRFALSVVCRMRASTDPQDEQIEEHKFCLSMSRFIEIKLHIYRPKHLPKSYAVWAFVLKSCG